MCEHRHLRDTERGAEHIQHGLAHEGRHMLQGDHVNVTGLFGMCFIEASVAPLVQGVKICATARRHGHDQLLVD